PPAWTMPIRRLARAAATALMGDGQVPYALVLRLGGMVSLRGAANLFGRWRGWRQHDEYRVEPCKSPLQDEFRSAMLSYRNNLPRELPSHCCAATPVRSGRRAAAGPADGGETAVQLR